MSRILYSNQVSDMRGKLNGSVHARNKGGAYVRTKVIPTNPKTSSQSAVRNQLSALAKSWASTLTQAQRDSWNAAALLPLTKTVYGNAKTLSGISLYQMVNLRLGNSAITELTDPPTDFDTGHLLTAVLTADSALGTLSLDFTPTPLDAADYLVVWATPAMSAGINNFHAKLRYIYTSTAALASPADLKANWVAKFGTFPATAGQKIGVRVQILRGTNGAQSPAFITSAILT